MTDQDDDIADNQESGISRNKTKINKNADKELHNTTEIEIADEITEKKD